MNKQFSTKQPNIELPGNNGRIIWPFSPPIYQTEISDAQRETMLEHGSLCEQNFEGNLAGNMVTGGSFQLLPEHVDHWEPILLEKVNMFMAGLKYAFGDEHEPRELLTLPDVATDRNGKRYGKLMLESLWINYQREGDHNPPHIHSGELSMVIFLDVPEHIFDNKSNGNTKTAGDLVFYNGERISPWQNTVWPVRPRDNLMFVFPSKLQHGVPPFYTQGCRVSVSGNWIVV